jgi:hypothetical protein
MDSRCCHFGWRTRVTHQHTEFTDNVVDDLFTTDLQWQAVVLRTIYLVHPTLQDTKQATLRKHPGPTPVTAPDTATV